MTGRTKVCKTHSMSKAITSPGVAGTDGPGLAGLARAWVEGWVVSRGAAPPVEEA